ncbi:MAG TPA: hypothetical protein VNQ73_11005 [Ilumatobacter sp.]|nr:hypothetical protein [Ilumatobacter sp.]
MRTRSMLANRGLVVTAITLGLVATVAVSVTLQAATNPSNEVAMACRAEPVGSDLTQNLPFSVSGPDTAEAGATVALTMDAAQATLPSQASGVTINNFSNLRTAVEAYGVTVTGASITKAGSHPASVDVAGSRVTMVIPGPIPGGQTITTPEVTITATVTAAPGGSLGLQAGASPFYQTNANVQIVGNQTVTCNPGDATQAANTKLTIPVQAAAPPDTTGPTITFVDPNVQSIYGYQEVVAASYACSDPSGVATCAGPVPNGGLLDTSTAGLKDFTVNATDTKGNTTTETVQYLVLPEGAPPPARARYTPLNPGRLLDTRTGAGIDTFDGEHLGEGKQGGGVTLEVAVGDRYDIPVNASGVVLNITATEADGPGHITVYPCGDTRPTASNLNYAVAGDTRPNAVVTKLGDDGNVCLYAFGAATHLVVDAAGYFPPGARFVALNPGRLLDTRVGKPTVDDQASGDGPSTVGTDVTVQVGGRHGVPDNAVAAVLNVTAVAPDGPGHLTVYPCGETLPTSSNLNYAPGDAAVPNLVVAKLGNDGTVCLASGVSGSDLIVDVAGYFPAGADYTALIPGRLLDTRAGRPTIDDAGAGDGKPQVGTPIELQVGGRHDIPADALGVVLNVTAADTDGAGYLKVWPCGDPEPLASNVNFTAAGQTRANAVFAKLGTDGTVCIVAKPASAHVVVDVAGFVPAPTGPVAPPPPTTTTTVPGQPTTTSTTTTTTTEPGATTTTTLPPTPGDCPQQAVYDEVLAQYESLAGLALLLLGPVLEITLGLLDPNGDGNACNG